MEWSLKTPWVLDERLISHFRRGHQRERLAALEVWAEDAVRVLGRAVGLWTHWRFLLVFPSEKEARVVWLADSAYA